MVFSMTDEVSIFLYSCLAGIIILFFYDILSLAGKRRECSLFFINVCDGIFVMVACVIMVFILFTVSNGIVRGFEFVGAALGATLYKLTLSPFVYLILEKLTALITSFFKLFFKILLTPLKFMYKMISKCISVLFRPVVKLLKKGVRHALFRARTSVRVTRKALRKS